MAALLIHESDPDISAPGKLAFSQLETTPYLQSIIPSLDVVKS